MSARAIFFAVALGATSLACSSILGLQEPTVDDSIEGGGGDSGNDSGGPTEGGVDSACGADLQNDAANCGTCGHGCQGGTCSAGKCQPVSLLSNLTVYSPNKIVEDATYLYFTNPYNGTVTRMGKDGSNPTTMASGLVQVWSLAITSTNLYITDLGTGTNDGAVLSCPLAGCGANNANATKIVQGSSDEPSYVAVSGNDLFVSFGVAAPTGRVGHCTLPCTSGPTTFAGNMDVPDVIRVAGSTVYWTDESAGIHSCAVGATCATPQLLVPDYGVATLTLDTTSLYWGTLYDTGGDATNAHVGVGPLAGTTNITQVATGQHIVTGIVVDSSNVYWTTRGTDPNYSDGILGRCPLSGCGASNAKLEVLAGKLNDARDVLDDGAVLYFTTYGDSTVWKIAK